MEYVGWAAVGVVVVGILSVIRVWFSDAGFDVLSVSVPKDGFRGKRVVIVGASTGIGHALALRLAQDGASLVVSSRNTTKLEALARECLAAGSPKAVALALDVLDIASHEEFAAAATKALGGPVDVLVNNAGRSQRSLAETTELKVTRDMFELNVFGNISITKAFLPAMLKRRDGHIVVTSSVAGKLGAPCSSSYSATKHAVQGYYNALRNEVSYRGVDVTLVCPGPVESDITDHAFVSEAGVKASEKGFAPDKSKRMTGPRCAELMARAIHHRKLYEIWVSPQPVLLFTMLNQYFPTFAAYIGATKVGPARTMALMGGKPGYESVQNVFSMLFGAEAKPKDE